MGRYPAESTATMEAGVRTSTSSVIADGRDEGRVTGRLPHQKIIADNKIRPRVDAVLSIADECAARDVAAPRTKCDLPAVAVHAFGVQHFVHGRGAGAIVAAVRPGPEFGEPVGVGATAFKAGPVTGGERRGLVQEEQLGVAVGLHDLADAGP